MMAAYPGVKPLFETNEEIIHYTKQTGVNPIMHVLSIRREIVERYPDFPGKLTRAFMEARDAAAEYMDVKEIAGYAKEGDVLGEDPYASGVAEMNKGPL